MSDYEPFCLYEAVLTLYPAAADGRAITGAAVWWGAVANGLRLGFELEAVTLMGSGERYGTSRHVDEQHVIEVDRTWIVRTSAGDFRPGRNQQYVLEIVWTAMGKRAPGQPAGNPAGVGGFPVGGQWYRRTYYGVTGRTANWDSRGVLELAARQSWRAQRYDEAVGNSAGAIYTPLPPATGDEQPVGFFRENAFIVGEYLLGVYRWPAATLVTVARLVAFPSQGTATTITLEVNGSLTPVTLTLPSGPANVEAAVEAPFSYGIPPGATVRWKITAGPGPEDAAWVAAVMMGVRQVS